MPRVFNEQRNIGRAKYVINFHDGESTHGDGSPRYHIRIFKNARLKQRFVRELRAAGYRSE